MAVFTEEQLKEIEHVLEKNTRKIAEAVLKDTVFMGQIKKLALEEIQLRFKS